MLDRNAEGFEKVECGLFLDDRSSFQGFGRKVRCECRFGRIVYIGTSGEVKIPELASCIGKTNLGHETISSAQRRD